MSPSSDQIPLDRTIELGSQPTRESVSLHPLPPGYELIHVAMVSSQSEHRC